MAKMEVCLREWTMGREAVTIEDLETALQRYAIAIDFEGSVGISDAQDSPMVLIGSKSNYMPVRHYIEGGEIIVSVYGKGNQVRAEDLAKWHQKASVAWSRFQYAKGVGGGGIAGGIGAATGLAIRHGFGAVTKGVRVLTRDKVAWENEMKFYEDAVGIGDFAIGARDSINMLTRMITQAQQDNTMAQYLLGVEYLEGRCVRQDKDIAISWFARAAENGETESRNLIIEEYLFGEKEYSEEERNTALRYLEEFSADGEAWANALLLDIYAKGKAKDVPIDYEKAIKLAGPYINEGYDYSALIKARILDQSISEDTEATVRFRDEAMAAELYQSIVDGDEQSSHRGEAARQLAALYMDGRGVEQNRETAIRYLEIAAEEGDLDASAYLAEAYAFSRGVPEDMDKAKRHANALASSGKTEHLPMAWYCKWRIADRTGWYKDSMEAARKYVALQSADPEKAEELRKYLADQEAKIAGMSDEERRAYLKEPPKKTWLKWALIGAGALLAVIIVIALVNANSGDDYGTDYDNGYYEEYDEEYSDEYVDPLESGEIGEYIGNYGPIQTDEEAYDLGASYYWETNGDDDEDISFTLHGLDDGNWVLKADRGIDEATGYPWVIWSVYIERNGDMYYWYDSDTEWMD